MTRQRNDNHSTEFGLWLRKQSEIDSNLGFTATNIDYVWRNYKTNKWMYLEEKRFGRELTFTQKQTFAMLDNAARNDPHYCGFHTLVFEYTSPDDGKIWMDGMEINKQKLITFLVTFKI